MRCDLDLFEPVDQRAKGLAVLINQLVGKNEYRINTGRGPLQLEKIVHNCLARLRLRGKPRQVHQPHNLPGPVFGNTGRQRNQIDQPPGIADNDMIAKVDPAAFNPAANVIETALAGVRQSEFQQSAQQRLSRGSCSRRGIDAMLPLPSQRAPQIAADIRSVVLELLKTAVQIVISLFLRPTHQYIEFALAFIGIVALLEGVEIIAGNIP